MENAQPVTVISVQEYLEGELLSDIRHEYVDGQVYAMSGGTNNHAKISANALALLWNALKSSPCRAFGADAKIRVQSASHTSFYYPDVSVICRENPGTDLFQSEPVVIIEVLSPSTRRTDEREKKQAYLSLDSLGTYILLEQDRFQSTVYQRMDGEDGFDAVVYEGIDAIIALPSIGAELGLRELYLDVEWE